jgi:hypothetical protein
VRNRAREPTAAKADGDNVDLEDLPDWQREALPKDREAVESDRFLALPGSFDVYGWSIMERFGLR